MLLKNNGIATLPVMIENLNLPDIPKHLEFQDYFFEVCAKTAFTEGERIETVVLSTLFNDGVFTNFVDILGTNGRISMTGSTYTDSTDTVENMKKAGKYTGKSQIIVCAGATHVKVNKLLKKLKGKHEFFLTLIGSKVDSTENKAINLTLFASNATFKALTAVLQGIQAICYDDSIELTADKVKVLLKEQRVKFRKMPNLK